MPEDQVRADIRHEFGHLVVAKVLGFQTGEVQLGPTEARAEIWLRPTLKSVQGVADYARRRVKVLYAGAGAQALNKHGEVEPNQVEQLLRTTSNTDHAKIRELLRIISAIEHPDAVADEERGRVTTSLDTELRLQTGEQVEKHSALILALTEFFMERKEPGRVSFTLSAADIDAFPGVEELMGSVGR
jgi:hypothetical protein